MQLMTQRNMLGRLIAAHLVLLACACEGQEPARSVEEADESSDGGPPANSAESGADAGDVQPHGAEGDASTVDQTATDGAAIDTDANVSDAGLRGASAICWTAMTTSEQDDEWFETCVYRRRCVAQRSDVMMAAESAKTVPSGPLAASTRTRPQLTETVANELYTIRQAMAAGGVFDYSEQVIKPAADAGPAQVGADGGTLRRTLTYDTPPNNWDPAGPLEDVTKIIPGIVVDPARGGESDSDEIYSTIGEAIKSAEVVANCPRVFIKLMPGTYREQVVVRAKTSAPPMTLYSTESDASKTTIVYGNSAAGPEVEGVRLSIQRSATFTQSLPRLFQARNFTIQNDYEEGTYAGDDQGAVALMNQGDQALYDNVRLLGNRHTVYVKATSSNEVSRSYFKNCYIEGDEDIILGRGTAVFDHCRVHSVGSRVPTGAVASASTRLENPHGILFTHSEFTADPGVFDVYLGRQWFESQFDEAVGKIVVRNSVLGAHIRSNAPWARGLRTTPKAPLGTEAVTLYTSDDYYPATSRAVPPEVFLAEYANSGPGAAK